MYRLSCVHYAGDDETAKCLLNGFLGSDTCDTCRSFRDGATAYDQTQAQESCKTCKNRHTATCLFCDPEFEDRYEPKEEYNNGIITEAQAPAPVP